MTPEELKTEAMRIYMNSRIEELKRERINKSSKF